MAAVYEKYTVRTVVDSYRAGGPYNGDLETFQETVSFSGYLFYDFNTATGIFTPRGSVSTSYAFPEGDYYSRTTLYDEFGATMRGVTVYGYSGNAYKQHIELRAIPESTSEERGDFVERLIAELGEYPENGVQDGFWYVLTDADAYPFTLYVQKGNALRTVQTAVVCKNGELHYGLAGATAGRD